MRGRGYSITFRTLTDSSSGAVAATYPIAPLVLETWAMLSTVMTTAKASTIRPMR